MPEPDTVGVTAIVVVHRVDEVATRRALESLLASRGVEVHLVVALNGGAEQLALVQPLTRELGVTLTDCGRNRGFAAAVNHAVRVAGRDGINQHVFLLNDDAWVEPDTIARCVDVMAAAGERCISVAPLVLHADHPDRVDSLGVVLRPNGEAFNGYAGWPVAHAPSAPLTLLGPSFSAALFRPGAFTTLVGPLDEHYFLYYEDVDWNLRAAHHGWQSVAAPGAIAHHQHALSTRRMGEARRYGIVQRNLLLCATTDLSWRSVGRVWVHRLVVHAKGLVTGPYRWERVRSVAAALVRLPGALRRRRAARGDTPQPDTELFAFSNGMEPGIDTDTYAPREPVEIRELTRDELSRIGEIDRSERIDVLFEQHGTELVARRGTWDASAWEPEGTGAHSVGAQHQALLHYADAGGIARGAFANGRFVGIGVVVPHVRPAIAQLAYLHVSHGFRSAGIGTRLCDDLELIARRAGDSEIVVSATPSEHTVRFYQGRGYRPMVQPLPELLELEPDDIHMSKAL